MQIHSLVFRSNLPLCREGGIAVSRRGRVQVREKLRSAAGVDRLRGTSDGREKPPAGLAGGIVPGNGPLTCNPRVITELTDANYNNLRVKEVAALNRPSSP